MKIPEPSATVAVKLGSIVVHLNELARAGGHELDLHSAKALAQDEDVLAWAREFDPAFLPVMRGRQAL
jgi:hypothetical protein